MISISRARAEDRFAAIEKRRQAALSEHEEAVLVVNQNTARLKALRLARDAKELADRPVKKTRGKIRVTKRKPD